jgi:glycosyltransferase involved in cell wall biosynthesis
LARFFNVKYIPILHGGDLPYRLKLNPKLCRMVFVNAYKNVAPSGYLKKAFEKEGYLNVIHIPNSIEIKNYEFKQRNEVNPRLLWVRAFANIYNPKMAVSVLFQLQKTYSNATLTMVGPDKDGSLITTKAFADQLGVKVNFTGKLSKEDWCRLAIDNDIFINTTHFDNMPVSVMEAMALGLPLVSTNVGGIPYLVSNNENAILVNDNDVEQMTKSILDLISDKEKAFNMSQNGRRLIEQIDWDIVKQKWFSLLK